MRLKLVFIFAVSLMLCQNAFAQVRTEEKKKTVTEQKGDTTITRSTIISESEDITPRHHMIVINPLKFLLFYNISYYQSVSDNIGIGAGVQAPTIGGINGFGLNAEIRFYPSQKSLRGFYLTPNISYNRLYHDNQDNALSVTSIGGLVGWQWFPGDDFAMGLGIGIDHYIASKKDSDIGDYDGNAPALRFDIGYGW
ncbi:MAG: hypothetical protein HZB59_02185 [Ignavibacteriales bacterium]|nr:hypothetical protein [Ignavibacteriales bacterium]